VLASYTFKMTFGVKETGARSRVISSGTELWQYYVAQRLLTYDAIYRIAHLFVCLIAVALFSIAREYSSDGALVAQLEIGSRSERLQLPLNPSPNYSCFTPAFNSISICLCAAAWESHLNRIAARAKYCQAVFDRALRLNGRTRDSQIRERVNFRSLR
jgi:hypothetical protein